MTKRERAEALRAHGWRRVSYRGAQTWRHPDPADRAFYTLAAAYRAEFWTSPPAHACASGSTPSPGVPLLNPPAERSPALGCGRRAGLPAGPPVPSRRQHFYPYYEEEINECG